VPFPQVGILKIDKGVVHMHKTVFSGLVFLAVLFMALFTYSSFTKKAPEKAYNSVAAEDNLKPYRSVLFVNTYNADSVKKARELTARLKADSIARRKAAAAAIVKKKTDSISVQEKPKKKRKKFLGIF
jgi:hypothetical protein